MDLKSVDVSLDDIIRMNKNKSVKKVTHNNNGGGQHHRAGGHHRVGQQLKRHEQNRWQLVTQHHHLQKQQPQQPVVRNSPKILVSNLASSVTAGDLEELFSGIGELQEFPVLHHDSRGKSLGSAEITFQLRADARKALAKYNGVALDAKPMRIQFTLNGEGGGMGARLGPTPNATAPQQQVQQAPRQIRQVVQNILSKPDCGNGMNQNTFGGNGGGGGFRGGRRAQSMGPRYGGGDQQQQQLVDRSSRQQAKKKNEVIDPNKLDMEMDAYMESHPGNSMC